MRKALFFSLFLILATGLSAKDTSMSDHVFVVSEWLPKENCEEELRKQFKSLMALTLENEQGCIRAHVTHPILHPGATGKTQYKIVLLQEFSDRQAFDAHCLAEYVKDFAEKYVINEDTSLVKEWRCRLLSEND